MVDSPRDFKEPKTVATHAANDSVKHIFGIHSALARPAVAVGAGIALIIVIALIVYGQLIVPGQVPYSRHSDIVPASIAVKYILKESIDERGELPYWRADQMSGGLATTQPQALYTYPFDFLFWLLPTLFAIGPTFWLHLLLAGFGCYVMGYAFGLSRSAKLLMGAAGLLSYKLMMIVYAGWLPIIPAISLLPWFIAAIVYFCKTPGLKRGLFLSATIAVSLHTGTLQYFFFATLVMLPFVIMELAVKLKGDGKRAGALTVGGLAVAGIVGFCTAVYLWLPVAVDIPMLSRMDRSYNFFLSGHALDAKHLITFLLPEALGSPIDKSSYYPELWEDVPYFGIVPLVLAVYGAWRRRGERTVRFLAVAFVLSALLAFDTPILKLVYLSVPGYDLFRCPARMLFITAYTGIALAGFGAEAFLELLGRCVSIAWIKTAAIAFLLIFMTTEAKIRASSYIKTVPHSFVLPDLPFTKFFKKDTERFRIASVGRSTLNYGWAAPNGLQIISGYDPYLLGHYQRYFGLLETGAFQPPSGSPWLDLSDIKRFDLLDALNVKYLITHRPINNLGGRFVEVGHFKDVPTFKFYRGMFKQEKLVFENRGFKRRAFFVDEVIAVQDSSTADDAMKRIDLTKQAVVLTERATETTASASGLRDRIEIETSRPGYLALDIKNTNRRFAVFSEIWHPGWSATIDGKELRIFQTDLALMGAWIEPGVHKLVLQFYPPLFKLGSWISRAAALFWLFAVVWSVKRKP